MCQRIAVSVLVLLAILGSRYSQAADFRGLGFLNGTNAESIAASVSPDGSAVVGKSRFADSGDEDHGFLWTATSGAMLDLGLHPTGQYYSQAHGVTNSLLVAGYADTDIVGSTTHYSGQAMRWSPPYPSAPLALPEQPTDPSQDFASFVGSNNSINGTGTVITGWVSQQGFCSDEATVWVNGTPRGLGWSAPGPAFPPPDCGFSDYSYASAVNTPGTHVVGTSVSFGGIFDQQAVLWSDPTAMWNSAPTPQALGQIGGTGTDSEATDITNDGLTVVGFGVDTSSSTVAFRGTVGNTNLVSLGDLVGGTMESRALSIAGNGATIVGWGNDAAGRKAVFWDPTLTSGNPANLQDFLISQQGLGTQLAGWTLREAVAISDDGRVIVGVGTNPMGRSEAFRVQMDVGPLVDPDFDNNGLLNCADIDLLAENVVNGPPNPGVYDLTGDGLVNTADRDAWLMEAGEVNLGPGRSYLLGDANLNSVVDGSDFGIWNSSKFTAPTPARYCLADFNLDGNVDGSDFGIWNAAKFTSSVDGAAVPEPGTALMLTALLPVGCFVARLARLSGSIT